MKKSFLSPFAKLLAGALVTLIPVPSANAAIVHAKSYLLSKGQHFIQTNASAPVLFTADKPFKFYSSVEPTAAGAVTNAIIRLPSTASRGMSNFLDVFEFERSFTSKEQLDAAFPEGQYTFLIDTSSDGRKAPKLSLPAQVFPPVPRVLNFSDLQTVESDQDLNLSWARFTAGTTNDYVIVAISEEDSDEDVFRTPAFLESEGLNGTRTSVTIPADTFSYDQTYSARLLFVKRSMLNTNSYPGAVGISGYFRETSFPLSTLSAPPDAGRVQFSASTFINAETNGFATVTVTRSGSTGQVSVNLSTSNGTAADGNDYVGANEVLTLNDGVTSTNISIIVNDDFIREGNETVQLSLSNPTGGAVLGNRSNAVLAILDNEILSAGTLQFSAPRYSFAEEGRVANLVVNRTGGSSGVVTANFSTIEGTAGAGTDFTSTNGVLRFGPGITTRTISIRVIDDKLDEFNERFSVVLTDLTGGAALGANASASVSIVDNDVAGVLSFSAATYRARENAGTAMVTVSRTGGSAGGVTVDYTTLEDTAIAGSDYDSSSGTLVFGVNETSKTFPVNILQDTAAEGNERFFVRLSSPVGRATLGTITNAGFVILDDESSVSFARASYVFSETNQYIVIPVARSGDLNTPVSIGYSTADITAIAGSDYRATNGVLNFPTNVPSRNIIIPVIRDHVIESDETLSLSLFNPQGGVQLGTFTNASITITNDDFAGRFAFSAATYSVTEGTAGAVVVKRAGGVAVGTTVTLQTFAGTAIAGTDFKSVTTNITFAGGEASKTIRIPTIFDITPEATETVTLKLSDATGGATLGTLSNAVLKIVNKPDPNAVPAAGESFMNVTITGLNGNPVSKSLNVVNNPVAQEGVSAAYNKTQKAIQGLTGSKTTVVLNGFSVTTTFHVLQLPFFKAAGPGVYLIDPDETSGGAIWTYNTSGGESHNYGTGRTGSSGNVIFDVVDPTNKILAGRFNFVAVKDGGSAKVRIQGSFRVKNVFVN